MSSWSSATTGATRPGHLSTKSDNRKGEKGNDELRTKGKEQRNLVGGPSARGRVGEQVCEVIVAYSSEACQMVGTSSKTPPLIVWMRRLANPETRGRVRPRSAEKLIEGMKRCCQANPDCAYQQECLELWNIISDSNVIPLRKGENPADPTKGRVMPGAWMAASCSKVVEYERRN